MEQITTAVAAETLPFGGNRFGVGAIADTVEAERRGLVGRYFCLAHLPANVEVDPVAQGSEQDIFCETCWRLEHADITHAWALPARHVDCVGCGAFYYLGEGGPFTGCPQCDERRYTLPVFEHTASNDPARLHPGLVYKPLAREARRVVDAFRRSLEALADMYADDADVYTQAWALARDVLVAATDLDDTEASEALSW